jgi:hypothetical protein
VKQAHAWTDEDRAYAAAQWASGIKQREIGAAFGCLYSVVVNARIREFLEKYGGLEASVIRRYGFDRKVLVKAAIHRFVVTR